ncbi:hypothetical protein DICPUDRAFT_151724 [Dictyostelium purpureum]|uniref:DUF2804 domain-containing protein n=1 Tax=Dictyostelium purpureum TaxID=5786 RepID=F0ZJM0_DICPU|nr:uncharacterized protein DICPUDRAFT_151724 [Dictyostelium purpureum]EGC35884.1 hypothetical protein DICPUDRAFT_151724 [Dictyostelium purpureum]|eukprot:XP_003287615.1 hypothetical protein DICPUDRAFT_151724 [Dictyostelium purpureum]
MNEIIEDNNNIKNSIENTIENNEKKENNQNNENKRDDNNMDHILNNNEEKRFQIKLDKGPLLNEKGEVIQSGYSTNFMKEYNRHDIKASSWRIKEWDYYFITNGKIGLALTFGDIGYIGNASVTFFNFNQDSPSYKTKGDLAVFPFGKFNFPKTPLEGSIEFNSKKISLRFDNNGTVRTLVCKCPNFDGNNNEIICNITLTEFPRDSMVIVTPFKYHEHAFYYNCKINTMVAAGEIKIGQETHLFDPNDSLAVLDWGRGVWPYSEVWYWGSLSCYLDDGRKFGFNIGYGFGNTKNASENMVFLDGIAHKLDEVEFIIPKFKNGKEDYMTPWKFTSNDKRLEMDFKPIINRCDHQNYLIIQSSANQVFGLFSGVAILDDGTKIEFHNKLGFAEKVANRW